MRGKPPRILSFALAFVVGWGIFQLWKSQGPFKTQDTGISSPQVVQSTLATQSAPSTFNPAFVPTTGYTPEQGKADLKRAFDAADAELFAKTYRELLAIKKPGFAVIKDFFDKDLPPEIPGWAHDPYRILKYLNAPTRLIANLVDEEGFYTLHCQLLKHIVMEGVTTDASFKILSPYLRISLDDYKGVVLGDDAFYEKSKYLLMSAGLSIWVGGDEYLNAVDFMMFHSNQGRYIEELITLLHGGVGLPEKGSRSHEFGRMLEVVSRVQYHANPKLIEKLALALSDAIQNGKAETAFGGSHFYYICAFVRKNADLIPQNTALELLNAPMKDHVSDPEYTAKFRSQIIRSLLRNETGAETLRSWLVDSRRSREEILPLLESLTTQRGFDLARYLAQCDEFAFKNDVLLFLKRRRAALLIKRSIVANTPQEGITAEMAYANLKNHFSAGDPTSFATTYESLLNMGKPGFALLKTFLDKDLPPEFPRNAWHPSGILEYLGATEQQAGLLLPEKRLKDPLLQFMKYVVMEGFKDDASFRIFNTDISFEFSDLKKHVLNDGAYYEKSKSLLITSDLLILVLLRRTSEDDYSDGHDFHQMDFMMYFSNSSQYKTELLALLRNGRTMPLENENSRRFQRMFETVINVAYNSREEVGELSRPLLDEIRNGTAQTAFGGKFLHDIVEFVADRADSIPQQDALELLINPRDDAFYESSIRARIIEALLRNGNGMEIVRKLFLDPKSDRDILLSAMQGFESRKGFILAQELCSHRDFPLRNEFLVYLSEKGDATALESIKAAIVEGNLSVCFMKIYSELDNDFIKAHWGNILAITHLPGANVELRCSSMYSLLRADEAAACDELVRFYPDCDRYLRSRLIHCLGSERSEHRKIALERLRLTEEAPENIESISKELSDYVDGK